MTNYYLDYEGGNDAGSGVSFATRWKTLTLGATAARIAPGDTIRIMGSPAVQSFGMNGTWTSSKQQATQFISSSTNTSPIVINLGGHGYVTGDTVVITGHSPNAKANGTWEIISLTSSTFSLTGSTGNGVGSGGTVRRRNNSRVIMASDPGVKNLASHGNVGNGRTAWTASANVTTSLHLTEFKEGDSADSIAIGASFTTGLAAYKATTSTLASTCVTTSFWIKQNSGTVAVANDVSIRLCSDIAGATSIKTIPVPALVTLGRWTVVSFDTSGLSGNIQSVALYVGADKGAQTFLISNIIGSGSDQVDLSCLIGKNTGTGMNAEPWCPIQSINGTRIMLDGDTNETPRSLTLRGYYGATETVPTYFRKTIKTTIASSISDVAGTITKAGVVGSPIVFSGGWDRTDMSTQPSGLATFFDGQNSQGQGIGASTNINYISIDNISAIRYNNGFSIGQCISVTLSNAQSVGNSGAGFYIVSNSDMNTLSNCLAGFNNYGFWIYSNASSNKISNIKSVGNASYGLVLQTAAFNNVVSSGNIFNNGLEGIILYESCQNTFKNINSYANHFWGIVSANPDVGGSSNNTFINCSAINENGNGGWFVTGYNYLTNCTGQSFSTTTVAGGDDGIYSMDHNGVSGNISILMRHGSVISTTSVRHTASGIAWALAPTQTITRTSNYPLTLNVATFAVASGASVTVKAWLRRTNTGLTLGLRILADQIAGVSSDVLSPMTAAANTWEEVSLTFTPTANGVVKIQAYCYGGSTYTGYVDDLTITQA